MGTHLNLKYPLALLKTVLVLACWASAMSAAVEIDPVRLDLRLMAADLVDDMVYSWLEASPLPTSGKLKVVVAEIDAPVGIGTRFEQDLENHLYDDLRANPKLPMELVHCALCRQWVTVSNPKRTLMGRALNLPEFQEQLRQTAPLYAISLHFDVVERDLVLWAELYEVIPPQKVVWSRRFSHSTSARSVLRDPQHLISISDARLEQEKLIAGRETIQPVTRVPIHLFKGKPDDNGQIREIKPLIFLEQSFESILSPRRNRRAGLSVGITSIKDSMQGWSFGASYAQLLWRKEPSLSEPDIYLRGAVTYFRLEGPDVESFAKNQLDVKALTENASPTRASLTAFQFGLEAHIKYRFGLNAFIEYIPILESNSLVATQRFIIPFHSIGVSGVFLW